jgi:sec-independent protein translocase protein TatC
MRRLLSRIGRFLTAPFRLIAKPARAAREFVDYEPDEASTGDVLAKTIQSPSVLVEHLEALRGHLLRAMIALAIGAAIGFTFARQVLNLLAKPIGGLQALQAIEVTESIGAFMRVSLLTGFAIAFPYILFELFAFVNPGLRRRERVLILIAIPSAFVLFLSGVAFAYFVMLPAALPFLLSFMGIHTVPRPANYITFVTSLLFWIGISFQFPLVIYALAAMGIVRARSLWNGWRFAVVGIAVLAAAVTPTVDPVNMGLVMVPMVGLYFLSIGMAALAQRGRARRAVETEPAADP